MSLFFLFFWGWVTCSSLGVTTLVCVSYIVTVGRAYGSSQCEIFLWSNISSSSSFSFFHHPSSSFWEVVILRYCYYWPNVLVLMIIVFFRGASAYCIATPGRDFWSSQQDLCSKEEGGVRRVGKPRQAQDQDPSSQGPHPTWSSKSKQCRDQRLNLIRMEPFFAWVAL